EAERFLAVVEDRLVNPPKRWDARQQEWREQKPRALRDYRLEIVYRDCPAVGQAGEQGKTRRRKGAAWFGRRSPPSPLWGGGRGGGKIQQGGRRGVGRLGNREGDKS